jgi:ribose 5-phosphate isomerase B
MKTLVVGEVERLGYEVLDVGASNAEPSDYPDFAELVAEAVVSDKADRGILVCGSGIGASVAANKVPGIRAGNCTDTYSAHQGVEHDDMNVLVLGSRVVGPAVALELVRAFLGASFTDEERHVRRLNKVAEIERRHSR